MIQAIKFKDVKIKKMLLSLDLMNEIETSTNVRSKVNVPKKITFSYAAEIACY